ncbi:serine protease [Streptomyces laurentii]|uniref:Serine protease n=1 Tax=Streptomyces laurentii TaxID=39478 RepID=A0A160P1J2_STRLU|nr:serine protease [Streptomyces laurentii]
MSTENEGTRVPESRPTPSTPAASPTPPPPASPATPPAAAAPEAPAPAPDHTAPATQELPTAPVAPPVEAAPATQELPTAPAAAAPEQAPAPAPVPVPEPPAQAPAPAQAPHYAAQAPAQAPAAAPGEGWPPAPPTTPAWGAPQQPVPETPRRKRGGGLVAAVLVAALVAGGIGGGVGYWAATQRDGGSTGSTPVAAGDSPSSFKRDPGTVAAVAAKALPSVVTITAKSGGRDGEGGTGTGFVYDKEGHIVTNNHVVASAADGGTLSATFSNGKTYDAEVVGRAQGYDVAVLKLKNAPDNLAPIPLGDSEKVAVGDSTIAIGAPFGLSNTVTTGIISAKNRPVASGDGSGGKNSYMSALQTDASINPGNSGGPLLDASGAVIGINSAIQSTSGGFGQSQAGSIGLGFAIPVNQARNVAEQLIKTGKPVYPVIGATVNMQDQPDGGSGAVIPEEGSGGTPAVSADGPAAKAGLKGGDTIVSFGGRPIDNGRTLIGEIWTHQPGDKVEITYKRDGKTATATVVLGARTGDS